MTSLLHLAPLRPSPFHSPRCPPFYDSSRDRVEQRIRSQAPAFPRSMSEHARSFITSALTKDASKRPSVLQLLNHPWINTYRARRSMRSINVSSSTAAAPAAKPASADITAAAVAAATAAAAAAPAAITPAHSVTMPATPSGANLGASPAAGSYFSGEMHPPSSICEVVLEQPILCCCPNPCVSLFCQGGRIRPRLQRLWVARSDRSVA